MTSIGVVVPCKDEATTIERCLAALRAQDPAPARILVVDNGSTDGGQELAARWADEVLVLPGLRIGALRNAGARALGDVDVLAFVDADCELAPGWTAAAAAALVQADLVGSRSLAAGDDTWVARRWAAIEARQIHAGSLLWSQQLAVRREIFQALDGFDTVLPTGEDIDLSRRIRDHGGRVQFVPGMVAVHHGFPSTISAFLARERWHTRGPGWFGRMSGRSQALVLVGAGWTAIGALSALRSALGRPAPLARWVSLTAAAVPGLGWTATRAPRTAIPDGILLGIWTAVRVCRLPAEIAGGRRTR